MPNNAEFYRGVLSELEKVALVSAGPNPTINPPPMPAIKPAPTTITPPKPGFLNNMSDHAGKFVGQVGGAMADFTTRHPILGGGFGAPNPVQDYFKGVANKEIGNAGIDDIADKPEQPGFMHGMRQGILEQDTDLRDSINSQSDPNSLYNKSLGGASVNNEGNVVKDWSKTPGYLMNKAEGWMGQHPWITGIGGGLALTGILAALFGGNNNNNQQPQQPQAPQYGQLSALLQRPTAPSFTSEYKY